MSVKSWKCTAPVAVFQGTWEEFEANRPELASWIPATGLSCDGGGRVGEWCGYGVIDCPFLSRDKCQVSKYMRSITK